MSAARNARLAGRGFRAVALADSKGAEPLAVGDLRPRRNPLNSGMKFRTERPRSGGAGPSPRKGAADSPKSCRFFAHGARAPFGASDTFRGPAFSSFLRLSFFSIFIRFAAGEESTRPFRGAVFLRVRAADRGRSAAKISFLLLSCFAPRPDCLRRPRRFALGTRPARCRRRRRLAPP